MVYARRRYVRSRTRLSYAKRQSTRRLRFAKRVGSRASRPMRLFTRPLPVASANIYKLLQGPSSMFPVRAQVRLKYGFLGSLPHTSGAGGAVLVNCNGLYGPEYGGGGHQPRYYDQLCGALLYTRYVVVGMKYSIMVPCAYNQQAIILVNASLNTTLAVTTGAAICASSELPYSQMNCSNVGTTTVISGYVDIAKVAGKTRAQLIADPAWGGDYNANPSNLVFLTVGLLPAANSTLAEFPDYFPVMLEFDAIVSDRGAVGSS